MRLVIFDVGGVVCENTDVVPSISASLNLTEEAFYAAAGIDNFTKLLSGAMSEADFWYEFARRSGQRVRANLWSAFFEPRLNQDVAALIWALRSRSRVVAGTNTFESHYTFLKRKGYYRMFNAVYASHKIKVSKPSPDFYLHVLQSERCEPCEAFFTDDSEVNVAAAAKIGLDAHRYVNLRGLRRALAERGLNRSGELARP